jgi:glycosyltransferase involved in cell wall biosynthesis
MKQQKPHFSLLMANCDKGNYIRESIESVINQTYSHWELLIIDDCSQDNSREIIADYLADPRIRYWNNSTNQGYAKNLIALIDSSQADIVGIIDSDDALDKEAVVTMLDVYNRYPNIGFAYSQFQICDEHLHPLSPGFCQSTPDGKSNLHFHHMNHFKTFRKSVYFKTSGYDSRIFAEDIDLWFKLEEVSEGLFVDKVLYNYRTLPDSQSHEPKKKLLCGMTAKYAKYLAYERRRNGKCIVPNISPIKMVWEMGKGLYLAIRLKDGYYISAFCRKLGYFISASSLWLLGLYKNKT